MIGAEVSRRNGHPKGGRFRGAVLFARTFLKAPTCVGAILPSSRALAYTLMAPFRSRTKPAKVLEVGAGTGAVTRLFGSELRDGDELTICEMQPAFADYLRREVLAQPEFAPALRDGRVRLEVCRLEELETTERFDYVISGVPFTVLPREQVQAIVDAVRGLSRPGSVFSYFEYAVLRKLQAVTSVGPGRRRVRDVSALLDEYIRTYQFDRSVVLANMPPALVRHLKLR